VSLVDPQAAVHLPLTTCTVPGALPEYCQQKHCPWAAPHSDIAVLPRRQSPPRPTAQQSEVFEHCPLPA